MGLGIPRLCVSCLQTMLSMALCLCALLCKLSVLKVDVATAARADGDRRLQLVAAALPGASHIIGCSTKRSRLSQESAQPGNFICLSRALNIPLKVNLAAGIKRKRLSCAAAKYVLERQEIGMQTLLENARLHRLSSPQHEHTFLAYSHEWDEARAYFAKYAQSSKYKFRRTRTGKHVQVMVQRGAVHTFMSDLARQQEGCYTEQWLSPPCVVLGTAARELYPALAKTMPQWFSFTDPELLLRLTESMDQFVFMPIGDKASSNVSIQRFWGETWENEVLPKCGGRIGYFPETCQVHARHRGKLQLKELRRHTCAHFSIANLCKLGNVDSQAVSSIEAKVCLSEEAPRSAP